MEKCRLGARCGEIPPVAGRHCGCHYRHVAERLLHLQLKRAGNLKQSLLQSHKPAYGHEKRHRSSGKGWLNLTMGEDSGDCLLVKNAQVPPVSPPTGDVYLFILQMEYI